MSFQVTKPGFYRQRNGGKAEVFAVSDVGAYGAMDTGDAARWFGSGRFSLSDERNNDLISEWSEPVDPGPWWRLLGPDEQVQAGDEFESVGKWLPIYDTDFGMYVRNFVLVRHVRRRLPPPEPPAGCVVMPREYVAKAGDWTCLRGSGWDDWDRSGKSAAQLDEQFPHNIPHYIAAPIPKPFSISEHGPGVYQTRDGREATITHKDGGEWPWHGCTTGISADIDMSWRDDGMFCFGPDKPGDLIRYLRPLPETTETWVPTVELRWSDFVGLPQPGSAWVSCHDKNGTYSCNRVLEQKWTRGSESEWRPVEVQP